MKQYGASVRGDVKYVPEFQLPGGGIDPGEHPIAALHREVMEETGWKIARPRRLGAFRRFVYMPEYELWAEKVCTVFVAYPVLRSGDPTEVGHSDHLVPVALAYDLVANPGDRNFVDRCLQDMRN
jgi:8-oxo-dGTP diphosphatase